MARKQLKHLSQLSYIVNTASRLFGRLLIYEIVHCKQKYNLGKQLAFHARHNYLSKVTGWTVGIIFNCNHCLMLIYIVFEHVHELLSNCILPSSSLTPCKALAALIGLL